MTNNPLPRLFGEVVRRNRQAAGLSQEALADRAGLHRVYIYIVEKGKQTPSLEVVHKLALALGTTKSKLMAELERLERAPKPGGGKRPR